MIYYKFLLSDITTEPPAKLFFFFFFLFSLFLFVVGNRGNWNVD